MYITSKYLSELKNTTQLKTNKNILCLCLVLILFLHTNYLAVYYSLYEINTEELTASCCEKIVVNCNAHCYLDKKMNEEDNKNTNGTVSDIKLKLTEYVTTEYSPSLTSDKSNIFYTDNYLFPAKDICSDIDHPPQL